jgi:hypothetical protein
MFLTISEKNRVWRSQVQLKKKKKKRNLTKPINQCNRGNLSYFDKPANHANLIERQNKKKKIWQKQFWKKNHNKKKTKGKGK